VKAVQEMEGYMKSKNVGLVLKPFDIDDLLAAIKQALKMQTLDEYPQGRKPGDGDHAK
jgi:DNA-binding NtrC family response regulator